MQYDSTYESSPLKWHKCDTTWNYHDMQYESLYVSTPFKWHKHDTAWNYHYMQTYMCRLHLNDTNTALRDTNTTCSMTTHVGVNST